jgi:hypothetical protein
MPTWLRESLAPLDQTFLTTDDNSQGPQHGRVASYNCLLDCIDGMSSFTDGPGA